MLLLKQISANFLFTPYLLSSVITLFLTSVLTGGSRALDILYPPLAFNKANVTLLMSVNVYDLMLEGLHGNEVNSHPRVCLSVSLCLLCLLERLFLPCFFSVTKHLKRLTLGKGPCKETALRDTTAWILYFHFKYQPTPFFLFFFSFKISTT